MIRLIAAESPRKASSPQTPIFLALEDIPGTYLVWHETCLTGTEGATAEEINKFCKLHLARYKVPKQVRLPRRATEVPARQVSASCSGRGERAKAPGSASATGGGQAMKNAQ